LSEWALLGKAWWHTTETDDEGQSKYDVVLFDAPSTGHGLDLLRVPKVICDIVPPGVLRRDAERAWALFQNPHKSGVLVVTLPEELPTTETIELVAGLNELELPIHRLIVNGMYTPLFSESERDVLLANEAGLSREDPGERALGVAARRAAREQIQADCLARLGRELGNIERVVLPFMLDGAGTPEGARHLAALL
jgi:anion-transporting  ArsA/GET3 family ATPase